MYFSGKLTIDPSQITKINKVRPQKAFKRMLFHLSAGLVSDEEEQETFTAISILQQLNQVFLSLGIDNIVRLAHDDIDFYLDTSGQQADLKDAFDQYDLRINEAMATVFNQLFLVLEHEQGSFHYLLEVDINRTHAMGAYPIVIKVNGLLKEFKADANVNAMKSRMKSIFTSQEAYETYVQEKTTEFNAFLHALQVTIMKYIRVEDVQVETQKNMVAPKETIKTPEAYRQPRTTGGTHAGYDYDPVYHGYYGMGDLFFYTLIWSTLAHDHHIYVQDTNVFTEDGDLLGTVGADGADAGELEVLSEDTTYEEGMQDANEFMDVQHEDFADDTTKTGGGWFDDGGDDFGDTDGGSSCSSCSSCGGCGGD